MATATGDPRTLDRRTWWWLIAAITAFGAVPRIIASTESLAWDELYLYEWVHGHGFGAMMETVRTQEKTPPLGFITAWLVDGFGGAPWTLRIPQLVAGIATVPMVALLARRVFTPATGIVAALFAAASPMLAFYSSEARSYSMTVALTLASTLLLLRLLETGSRKAAAGYALVAAAALMSHYTAVSVLLAQALLGLALWPRHRRLVLAAQAGPLLATLAWLPGMANQVRIASDELARIATVAPLSASSVTEMGSRALFGHPLAPFGQVPGTAGWVALAAGAAIALAWAIARLAETIRRGRPHRPRREVAVVFAAALAAPLLAVAISAQPEQSMLFARNVLVSVPYAVALVAGLIQLAPRPAAIASTALITAGLALGTSTTVTDAARPATRAAAAEVMERWKPGDRIVEVCCRAGSEGPLGSAVRVNLPPAARGSLSTVGQVGYWPLLIPLAQDASIFVIAYEPHRDAGSPVPGRTPASSAAGLHWWLRPLEFKPPREWEARFKPVAGGRFDGVLDTVWAEYRRRDDPGTR